MEEIQSLSQAERSRITRKKSVAEDDLDVNGKVERVLDALQDEDELEKSKVAKVFKEKSNLLTLGIKKTTLKKVLTRQSKADMSFPRAMGFKATGKIFTNEDSNKMSGRNYTSSFQCSVIKLAALNQEIRERTMEELIPNSLKEAIKYDEDLEGTQEDGEAAASQDFPEVGQHQVQQKPCNFCDYMSASSDNLTSHIGEEHPRCNVCGKQFTTDGDLRAHLPSHAMVKCSQCGKEIQKKEMKKHKEEHKTIEEFKKSVNNSKIKKIAPKVTASKNPWVNFCKEQRENVKRKHPLYDSAQVTKELGLQWRRLTEEEKANYRELNQIEEEQIDMDNLGGGNHGDEGDRQVSHWQYSHSLSFFSHLLILSLLCRRNVLIVRKTWKLSKTEMLQCRLRYLFLDLCASVFCFSFV